jgi:hypothetical protein
MARKPLVKLCQKESKVLSGVTTARPTRNSIARLVTSGLELSHSTAQHNNPHA